MHEPRPGYTIGGGRTEADRLARQGEVMRAGTTSFLARTGLRPGWACLDIGCGTGQITLDLARLSGPEGRVVGIDRDSAALVLARQAAAEEGLDATFIQADATAPFELGTFDLAFARLLLSHLADPVEALRAMVAAVSPGGVVALEDIFTDSLRAEPPTEGLERLRTVYEATVRFHGGDPTIGPRLPALLTAVGLEEVREDTVVNPMTTVDQKLFLVELLDTMRPAILGAGAATETALDDVRRAVDRAAHDPAMVFFQARMHQAWGRRPFAGPDRSTSGATGAIVSP